MYFKLSIYNFVNYLYYFKSENIKEDEIELLQETITTKLPSAKVIDFFEHYNKSIKK